jgi:hypothetical protein
MKKLTQTLLTVSALVLSTAGMNAQAQDGTTDPNAPGAAPAPDTYQALWNSVQVRHELVKTYVRTQEPNGLLTSVVHLTSQQSVAISGSLGFKNTSHVIGVDLGSLQVQRALDDQGKEVKLTSWTHVPSPRVPVARNYHQLLYRRSSYLSYVRRNAGSADLDSLDFSVQLNLMADQNVPASLSLVECQASVLCARSYLEVDVPFAASSTWHEPVPGLRIRVLNAYAEFGEDGFSTESLCAWRPVRCFPQSQPFEAAREPILAITWPGDDPPWLGALDGLQSIDTTVPAYVLLDAQLLDADGIPYPMLLGQEMRNDYRGMGAYCDAAVFGSYSQHKTIRHIFAVEPYDARIPITLRDVPIAQEDTGPAPEPSARTR